MTSMTTTEANTPAGGSVAVRPSIAEPGALSELLSYAASDLLASAQGGAEIPAEAAERIIFGLAGIFSGESGIVDLPDGWDLASTGARLRPGLAPYFERMTPEDRAIFSNDAELIVLAVHCFLEEALALAEEAGAFPSGADAQRAFLAGPEMTAVCDAWADWLLGRTAESPLEALGGASEGDEAADGGESGRPNAVNGE